MANYTNNGDFGGHFLSSVATALPKVLAALLVILIGYVIAKLLCKVVKGLLDKANLDQRLHSGHGGNMLQKAVPSPSGLVAKVVFWLVFLFAISTAVGGLGIPLLTGVLAAIFAFIPKVVVSVIIFLVAGAASGAVAGLVQKTMGDTATGKVVKTVAPTVIMSIAGFMILNELMIAPAIVTITYAALMFSSGLGLALAFGLGGRETAAKLIAGAYDKGQSAKEQVKEDVKQKKQESRKEVEQPDRVVFEKGQFSQPTEPQLRVRRAKTRIM